MTRIFRLVILLNNFVIVYHLVVLTFNYLNYQIRYGWMDGWITVYSRSFNIQCTECGWAPKEGLRVV